MENKHAFLIGCYKNPDYLYDFIESLDGVRSSFYIHVNKENLSEFEGLKKRLEDRENITFVPSIKVKWGGISLLRSLSIMLNIALKDTQNWYFHFMTGQDAVVVSIEEIYDYFDKHIDQSYIHVMDKMNPVTDYNVYEIDYIQYYHLFDILNVRNNLFARCIEKILVLSQKLLKIRRPLPYPKIYKGRGWFSINRKAAEILSKSLNDEEEIKKWKHTFATEEFFIPTVLMNSDTSLNFVNKSFYYIDWFKGPGPYPSILDMSFFDDIISSNCFFCRKIDPVFSKELLKAIKSKIKNKDV